MKASDVHFDLGAAGLQRSSQQHPIKIPNRSQRGMGLVEMLLALSVSAMALAGGLWAFNSMREQSQIDTHVTHVTQVITKLQAVYGASGYASLSLDPGPDYNCAVIPVVVPPELLKPGNDCPSASSTGGTGGTGGTTAAYPTAYHVSDGRIQVQPVSNFYKSVINPNLLPSNWSTTDYVALVWDRVPSRLCAPLVRGTLSLATAIYIRGMPDSAAASVSPQVRMFRVKFPGYADSLSGLDYQCYLWFDPNPPVQGHPANWVQIIYVVARS
jgi:prepilin-type N-terminal cleavage/methylation domain-containing protein